MLAQHPALKTAMRDVRLEPAFTMNETGPRETFARFITTPTAEGWTPVAHRTVSDGYKLVTNHEFVSAVEVLGDLHGFKFEPAKRHAACWRNGRTIINLAVPSHTYTVPGDLSPTTPLVRIENDFAARSTLGFGHGIERLTCTNGMVLTLVETHETKRHIGDWTLQEWLQPMLRELSEKLDAERELAFALAGRQVSREFVEKLQEAMPKRYAKKFSQALYRYVQEFGARSGWAVVQAASEIASHDMERKHERTVAADNWMNSVLAEVLAATELNVR